MNQFLQAVLRSQTTTMTCVNAQVTQGLEAALQKEGYKVHVADLEGATNALNLFQRITANLPYGQAYLELHNGINLPAFADIFRSGLWEEINIALLVTHADCLVEHHLNLAFDLFTIFSSVSYALSYSEMTKEKRKVVVFLIGTGDNFNLELPTEAGNKVKKRPILRSQDDVEKLRLSRQE